MHRIMVEQNAKLKADGRAPLDSLPKPCDHFDLIGGTSTGGCATSSLCSLDRALISPFQDNSSDAWTASHGRGQSD